MVKDAVLFQGTPDEILQIRVPLVHELLADVASKLDEPVASVFRFAENEDEITSTVHRRLLAMISVVFD